MKENLGQKYLDDARSSLRSRESYETRIDSAVAQGNAERLFPWTIRCFGWMVEQRFDELEVRLADLFSA